ncbi:hypothetical protein FOL46_007645, partial [Perkinsus olseni]
ALNAQGHRSRICTHDKFRDFVTKQGIEFFPLALAEKGHWQPETLMRYAEENPGMGPDLLLSPRDLYHFMFHGPEMQHTLKEIYFPPGWEDNTVGSWASVQSVSSMRWVTHAIIANPPSYTHVHLAERLGVPLQMFFTMPWTKTEAVGHPLCVNEPDTNPYWKKMSYRWMEQIQWRGVASAVNKFRRKVLHLPSIGMWHGAGSLIDKWGVPFAYCFAKTLLPKPADWGPNIDITGFCFGGCGENTTYVPPPQLAEFLDAGSPPFYVGFGSISGDLSPIYRAVLSAVKTIPELRVILHKGWCDLSGITKDDFPEEIRERIFLIAPPPAKCPVCKEKVAEPRSFFCEDCATSDPSAAATTWEYEMVETLGFSHVALLPGIPHDWLFPRCCACMHHGGAGTTAMGLDCGLPTTVVAFFGDQPLWGGLVEVRGGGKMVLSRHVCDDNITEAMKYCLSPAAKEAAMELKKGLANERAAGQGAEAGAAAFDHQLPLELVTCKVCSMRDRHEAGDTRPRAAEFTEVNKDLRICPVCALLMQKAGESISLEPLRTADWSRTRGGILYVHFIRWLKSFVKLFRRMVQGGQEGGLCGFFIGVVVGIFEFLVFVVVAPFIFIRDLFRVATQIVVPANGRSHCGYKIDPSIDFLKDMVLVSSPAHGLTAVNVSTLTDKDYILTEEEVEELESVTRQAVGKVLERRKEVEALTKAVCSLIEMRGVGMELTADRTVNEAPETSYGTTAEKEEREELAELPGDVAFDEGTISGLGGGIVASGWVRSAPRKALESVWSTEERNGSSEEFGIISVGQAGTTSYELECCTHVLGSSSGCQPISFWHDVPLYVGEDEEGLIRMVVEIPRFTRAKMEINRESYKYPAMNPIRQDLFKDGSLREYPGAIYWNYGAAPQTFEDPSVEEEPGLYGDGDPLDLIEVGRPAVRYRTGQIINVKILGAIGLVDGGEADWKIIVISTDDPLFEQINDITELEASYPNTVSGIREWFRWYKYPSHGVINSFMHGGQPLNRRKAISLVARTHAMWKRRFSPDPELSEV